MFEENQATDESPNFLEAYDFVIDTDGSGVYTDGFGGWASSTKSAAFNVDEFDMGASTSMNTNRAEFMGLLTGLRRALDVVESQKMSAAIHTVLWCTDRESLTYGISNPASRKADPYLWAQYAFYEKFFRVTAKFIPRTTTGVHQVTDLVSSEMRNLLINYSQLTGKSNV